MTTTVARTEMQKPSLMVRLGVCYAVFFPIVLVTVVGLSGLLVFMVPKFKDVFRDFNTTLPTLTLGIMELTSLLSEPAGWLMLLVLVVVLPVMPAVLTGLPGSRKMQVVVGVVLVVLDLLFTMAMVALIILALFLPLVKLIHSVSGAPGGGGV